MCRFFMLFYLAIYFSSFRSAAYIVFFLIHFAPSVALILFPYRFDWKCGE